MELGSIIEALYESEINSSITTFWDGGITAQLEDATNGFVAEANFARTSKQPSYRSTAPR